MTSYLQALEEILSRVQPMPGERVPLELAHGRALCADALAPFALPAHDNSAMDGYAVRAADLLEASEAAPVTLRVAARITAGDRNEASIVPGQAARIMTGGIVPPGADAVVMQEEVRRIGDEVELRAPCALGEHIRPAGADIRLGEVAVRAGVALGASELALLAALGNAHVLASTAAVALISTGDELVDLGGAAPGKLVDSNALALGVRLRALGAEVVALGVAPDSAEAIRTRFEAARGCEVVVSSAGVSVGEKDYVKSVLSNLGANLHVDRVAIRPGKPLVFASIGQQIFFGLPGNPVSSRVTFEIFVRPAIRKLLGIAAPVATTLATLSSDFEKPEPLTFFARVEMRRNAEGAIAVPVAKQGSGYLTSLVGAHGLAIFPAGIGCLRAGERVEVIPLE